MLSAWGYLGYQQKAAQSVGSLQAVVGSRETEREQLMSFESKLRDAQAQNVLVRIERSAFEETCPDFLGYVLGVSDTLVCLANVDDRVRFNGIDVFFHKQISDLEVPSPHATFYETALRLRGDTAPATPEIDLSSMKSALGSIAKLTPLVVIHREIEEPEACEIGQIAGLEVKTFQLREIDPDADWAESASSYPYAEVTRVGFGGDYEGALALVAGAEI
ncbi:MAG: hypothetical protein ACI8W3_002740 [Myxococcota bacterium]